MLTFRNIRKSFGVRRVLDRVSFSLGEGQKIALVGQNGVGKSTLLKIAAGLETAEKGEVQTPNRALIGYLPQESEVGVDETLIAYLRRLAGLDELEEAMARLEKKLDKQVSLDAYERLASDYRRLGGYDFERKARRVLEGLSLGRERLARPVAELSGGERRKAALAGVLLRGVDILLLDEPTNNLDLPALLWLEKFLSRSRTTCLIASHDRTFLDHVVRKVVEIDWFKRDVTVYAGGWSEFAEMKAHAHRKQKELYRMQEEERERLRASQEEKKGWVERTHASLAPDRDKLAAHYKKERAIKKFSQSMKALEGREKRLTAIDRPLERLPLVIPLTPGAEEEDCLIRLDGVYFGYPGGFSGGPVTLDISLGSRLAILGINGAGKSTLLKTITGESAPLAGTLTCGAGIRFGYLMQEHERLSLSETPIQAFRRRLGITDREAVLRHLSQFQFPPDVADDKLRSFSPGERIRFILCLLSASGANVLLLDEPTNHLDLEAIEALEEALEDFVGTILLVTHDRRFLENMRLEKLLVLEKGLLREVADYETYAASVQPLADRALKRLEER